MRTVYLHIGELRGLGYCMHGVRRFCTRHELDFKKLVRGEMPIEEFEKTGDALALRAVKMAKIREGVE